MSEGMSMSGVGDFLGGAAAFGGLIGGSIGGAGQNRKAKAEARRGRRHQINILQNQIGWKMWDLEKAGLNPILAAGGAFGGGAPSGPQAPVVNPGLAGAQSASAMASGARNAMVAAQELSNMRKTEEVMEAQRLKTVAETTIINANAPVADLKNEVMEALIREGRNTFGWLKSLLGDPAPTNAKQRHDHQRQYLLRTPGGKQPTRSHIWEEEHLSSAELKRRDDRRRKALGR